MIMVGSNLSRVVLVFRASAHSGGKINVPAFHTTQSRPDSSSGPRKVELVKYGFCTKNSD